MVTFHIKTEKHEIELEVKYAEEVFRSTEITVKKFIVAKKLNEIDFDRLIEDLERARECCLE